MPLLSRSHLPFNSLHFAFRLPSVRELDQINTELKVEFTDPKTEVGTEYQNDPDVELGTEFENGKEAKLRTEFKNDPEAKLGTEFEDDPEAKLGTVYENRQPTPGEEGGATETSSTRPPAK